MVLLVVFVMTMRLRWKMEVEPARSEGGERSNVGLTRMSGGIRQDDGGTNADTVPFREKGASSSSSSSSSFSSSSDAINEDLVKSLSPPSFVEEATPAVSPRRECGETDDDLAQGGDSSKRSDDVADGRHCNVEAKAEYAGDVVGQWGSQNIQPTAEDCCRSCQNSATLGCNVWVWCGKRGGCRGGDGSFGECWLKRQLNAAEKRAFNRGEGVPWTSGAIFTRDQAEQARAAISAEESERDARRNQKGNAHVYLDVSVNGGPACRMEFVLYHAISPLAAENFRQMCTGEKNDGLHTFVGANFYRILDRFIDQTGVHAADSVYGGAFNDDPGGLKLKHDRPGLLSVANSGPNTNTGHFSILMAPAPHLDTHYVVFGELVRGLAWAKRVNKLATPSGTPSGRAEIVGAGQIGWM